VGDGPDRKTLYSGGEYYEQWQRYEPGEKPQPGDPQRIHYPVHDGSGMFVDPQKWVDGVRGDIEGKALRQLLSATKGLGSRTNADGSVTYSGTAAAKTVSAEKFGIGQLPSIASPTLMIHDPDTPVAVTFTVGADGLIREVRTSYESDGAKWEYVSTYSKLGSTPAIAGPDPKTVVEWEQTQGKG
jgi:hypothetical protein